MDITRRQHAVTGEREVTHPEAMRDQAGIIPVRRAGIIRRAFHRCQITTARSRRARAIRRPQRRYGIRPTFLARDVFRAIARRRSIRAHHARMGSSSRPEPGRRLIVRRDSIKDASSRDTARARGIGIGTMGTTIPGTDIVVISITASGSSTIPSCGIPTATDTVTIRTTPITTLRITTLRITMMAVTP